MIGLLWLWPVRQGWEAYSYQPAATFDPSGQIVAVFDGKDSEASRLEVSYVSSPALDPEQPVDVELRFQTTWGSEHAPSILFLGAMATKLESCVASAAVLTTKQCRMLGRSFQKFLSLLCLLTARVRAGRNRISHTRERISTLTRPSTCGKCRLCAPLSHLRCGASPRLPEPLTSRLSPPTRTLPWARRSSSTMRTLSPHWCFPERSG